MGAIVCYSQSGDHPQEDLAKVVINPHKDLAKVVSDHPHEDLAKVVIIHMKI